MSKDVDPIEAARVYAELMSVGKPGGAGKPPPLWWGAIRADEWPGFYKALVQNDREALAMIEREMRDRLRHAAFRAASE